MIKRYRSYRVKFSDRQRADDIKTMGQRVVEWWDNHAIAGRIVSIIPAITTIFGLSPLRQETTEVDVLVEE